MKKILASILALGLSLSSGAQTTLSDTAKLDFIRTNFTQAASPSQYWQNGWLALFGGSAVIQGATWAISGSDSERYDGKVGFISSALGVGDLLMNPMPTHHYAQQFKQQNVNLEQAEQWLADAAAKEQYQRSFLNHFLSGLVSAAAGLAVGLDDKRPSDGWLTFATNMLASEVKIFTSPTHMTKTWQAYQQGNLEAVSVAPKSTAPQWQVAAAGPVLILNYQF